MTKLTKQQDAWIDKLLAPAQALLDEPDAPRGGIRVTSGQILKALGVRASAAAAFNQARDRLVEKTASVQSLVNRALKRSSTYKAVTGAAQTLFTTEGKASKRLATLRTQVHRATKGTMSLKRLKDGWTIAQAIRRPRASKAAPVWDFAKIKKLDDARIRSMFQALKDLADSRGIKLSGVGKVKLQSVPTRYKKAA